MLETTIGQYLTLIDVAYYFRGGLRHQREPLKTTSGRRIRARMVEDIKRGAVLPPVVIGLVAPDSTITSFDSMNSDSLIDYVGREFSFDLAIIDGMQRTTAMLEAVEENAATRQLPVRLEIWVSSSTDSLIYRMLILNTGQVPWNLKQQLQVVFEPLIKRIEEKVRFARLLRLNERRFRGGEFNANDLIEAYIAFGLRRTEVDTQEALADEFSRLDMADALTSRKYDNYFYDVVQMMVDTDVVFDLYNQVAPDDEAHSPPAGRDYSRGRNILDSQPARIGFIVAHAVTILGRVGMDRDEHTSLSRLAELRAANDRFTDQLRSKSEAERREFLALDVLAERLSRRPSSAVGRWERAYFESAFKILVEERYEVPSMETCWRA